MPLTDKEHSALETAENNLRAALSLVLNLKKSHEPKKKLSEKKLKAKAISQALIAKMDKKVKNKAA